MSSAPDYNHARTKFESLEDFLIRPANVAEEKELYQTFYDRIYSALRQGTINYTEVAEISGLKERRIREVILYRLGSGEVRQLFGSRKGTCYICQHQLYRPESLEPVCLKCLQQIDYALYQDLPDSPTLSTIKKTLPQGVLPEPDNNTNEVKPPAEPVIKHIPLAEYEALVHERDYYRTRLSELMDGNVPEPPPFIPSETPTALENQPEPAITQADQEFLSLLDMPEEEIGSQESPPSAPLNLPAGESLQHYGFKRLSHI